MPSLTKVQTGFLAPQGAFELDPGTASAPGLKFSTSAATGMFSPSTGVLGFSTGSTQNALTILANGNIGIGTTNPYSAYKLHVAGDLGVGQGGFSQQLHIKNDGIQSLLLGTAYTSLLLNSLGGNVGVGTTNPTEKLDVNGIVSAFVGTFNAGGYKLKYYSGSADSRSWWMLGDIHSYGDFGIRQSTTNSGSTFDTKLYINPSGNVGIGTTAPLYNTHIYGSVNGIVSLVVANKLTDVSSRAFFALENDTGGQGSLHFTGSTFNNTGYARPSCLALYTSSANTSGGIAIAARNSSGYIDFYTGGGTQRAIIDSAGNVGIGTTDPSYKLEVNGSVNLGTSGVNGYKIEYIGSISTGSTYTIPGGVRWQGELHYTWGNNSGRTAKRIVAFAKAPGAVADGYAVTWLDVNNGGSGILDYSFNKTTGTFTWTVTDGSTSTGQAWILYHVGR